MGLAEFGAVTDASTESVQAAQSAPGGTVIPAQTAALLASPETASILRDAGPSNAVTVQRRNSVSYDPHVRGFRYGQVLSRVAGVWSPVRQDLDSPISKLDPSLIEDISVIPGPYASRFGPAFSFIDVETIGTPRHENGYETHYHVGETYRHNGSQNHGRASVSGGLKTGDSSDTTATARAATIAPAMERSFRRATTIKRSSGRSAPTSPIRRASKCATAVLRRSDCHPERSEGSGVALDSSLRSE